jgi:predicted Zn finger-like uncharacterized protein
MYSQCPECQTRFRVTAEVLRAAHGTVRCGRCGSAFDALARLSDSLPTKPGNGKRAVRLESGADLVAATSPRPVAEYHFSADDLEKVFIDARDWQQQFGAAAPSDPLAPAGAAPAVMVQEDEPIEDITLEGERISIETPPGLEDLLDSPGEGEVAGEIQLPAPAEDRYATTEDGFVAVDDQYAGDDWHLREQPTTTPDTPEPVSYGFGAGEPPGLEPTPRPEPTLAARRWRREPEESAAASEPDGRRESPRFGALAWTLGSLVLAAALAGQLIHHFRQDLVRHPRLGPTLRGGYERLGLPLSPDWDLAAFEVRQWGSSDDPAPDRRMTVRASLTNQAGFAQPHPILRLELEDRFGEAVAVRDFEPSEYLKNGSDAARLLDAGATTEAELLIADPGKEAVGYRLDVCLRESAALLRCARGPG